MSDGSSAIIIGSGAAGSACARALADAGWQVTVVDRAKIGGTCLWRGCIPKKALATTAGAVRDAALRFQQFGVDASPSLDWDGALAWKWHAQETYAGDQRATLEHLGVEVISSDARFVSETEVELEGGRRTADAFVIATGASPVLPEIPGADLLDTSDDALRYPHVPKTMLVIGGGFIALELAAIYASVGTRVGMLVRGSQLMDAVDADIAEIAVRRLGALGVTIATGTNVVAVEGEAGDIHVTTRDQSGIERVLHAERVLSATGRAPALADLSPAGAGIELSDGNLVLDGALRTTNPRVWAAGDAAGLSMHTPVANLMGRTVASSLVSGSPVELDLRFAPFAVFTTPQIAQVGLTEEAARATGAEVAIGTREFSTLGAGVVADERDGLVKLVFDAGTGRLLGGSIAGPTASDLIYSVELALRAGMTAEDLRASVAIHPAFCEALANAAWY